MALIAKENSGGGDFQLIPPGSYLSRCYRILDLGTQKSVYKGTESYLHKIMLTFEVHGDDADSRPLVTSKGEPLSISKTYTLSLGEKANLRKDLESWRSRKFTPEEVKGFNLNNVLGVWAMISIVHDERDQKTYANISGVMKVPDAMKKSLPNGYNSTSIFDLEDPDMTVFATLSEKLQDKIKGTPEWTAIGNPESDGGFSTPDEPIAEDDDIPF